MSENERKAFESWISAPPFEMGITRYPPSEERMWPGQYCDINVELAWEAWQASAVVNQSLTTGWQPIESAPKGGEIILIASITNEHVMVRDGRWDEAAGRWFWPWWTSGITPTLWMPLPPIAAPEVPHA